VILSLHFPRPLTEIKPAPNALDPAATADYGARMSCFHCGAPNPPAGGWRAVIDGAEREFCCGGCLGVAQTIRAAGLEHFYAQRTATAERPSAGVDEGSQYDAAVEAGHLVSAAGDEREASLLLEGVRCAACVWLIESWLRRQPGAIEVGVNFATHRARLRWNAREAKLSNFLHALAAIGYRAYPYDPARREALARREGRALLTRTAIALLAMMQVMMFALPAYITTDGIEPQYQALLDWASLALTLPIVLYCAAPFFAGACRDLARLRLGMDVPVAIGVSGAFAASVASTLGAGGPVYYDSVTMFVALLLVTRYFELRAREKSADAIEAIAHELPAAAHKLSRYPDVGTVEIVAASSLRAGEVVLVPAGATIPADGEVIDGRSSVEEAVLTGESWPCSKSTGDAVLAGSINRASPLTVRVTAAGETCTLAALSRLVERASAARPRFALVADRVAGWFVGALLAIAALTAMYWWQHDSARALAVTLAVLVVSCPCALSIATPAAIAAATGALGRKGILAVRGGALETLARVTHVVVDKTGTLTTGEIRLVKATASGRLDSEVCLALAAALEAGSAHPIARALSTIATPLPGVDKIEAVPGCGVEGEFGALRVRLGKPEWVAALHGQAISPPSIVAPECTLVALADAKGSLAWLEFGDSLRAGARELVAQLRALGLSITLLSGDRSETVRHAAVSAGIEAFRGDARPEDKREFVAAMQREGAIVAMLGDGVNDAPSLAQADVSLALGNAASLTQWSADIVVLGEDIGRMGGAFGHARRAFGVLRQNLAWAIAYNALAIPLAVAGYLTPVAAALGMSASSFFVVANALRLSRLREPTLTADPAPAHAAEGNLVRA
jgi:Cu2+-exporting ATPase